MHPRFLILTYLESKNITLPTYVEGGVRTRKFLNHEFDVTDDQKVSPSKQTFILGFEAPDPLAPERWLLKFSCQN